MAERAGEGEPEAPADAPWWASAVCVALLALMVAAFVLPIRFTAWPVTSWELFSRPRSAEQPGYEVELVVDRGEPELLAVGRLGPEHRRWLQTARRLPSLDAEGKTAICQSWADAAVATLALEGDVELRVHRAIRRAADDPDVRPVTVRRTLVVTCGPTAEPPP